MTGLATGVGAIGAVVGAAIGARTTDAGRTNPMPGLLVIVVGAVIMVPLTGSPLLLIGFFILSAGEGLMGVRSILIRQLRIPAELSGRVNTLLRVVILGSAPLSPP